MSTKREIDDGLASTGSRKLPVQSLSQLFQECLQRYSQLCLALGEGGCEVVRLEHIDLEKARGEFGRLRLGAARAKRPFLPMRGDH